MGANVSDLTAERLREVLRYCPETGVWTWLVARQRIRVGNAAGSITSGGYRHIVLEKRRYLAHRLAFLYMTGAWPSDEVDHIDLDRGNDRWSNLRNCTRSQNSSNKRVRSDSITGLKGVSWNIRTNKWLSRIRINGNLKDLGRYDCPAAAHFAYLIAADKHFGEFARAA